MAMRAVLFAVLVVALARAEQATMMASRGALRERTSGCALTATCCPAMRMFVATCPHEGGVCCGSTGYCCPADFKCHVSGTSASCVKKVAVLPDVNKVLPVLSPRRAKINMLPPGHIQRVVEQRPDGSIVTTTTSTVKHPAAKAKKAKKAKKSKANLGGAVSMKTFRKLEKKAHQRAQAKLRKIRKRARKQKRKATKKSKRRSKGRAGSRRNKKGGKKGGKRKKGKRLARLPPPPKQKKGSTMFPSDGIKGPSKSKKLAAKVAKLKKKEKKAKKAEKKALKKAGVKKPKGGRRGRGRGRGRARRGGGGGCNGNACGTPHRVKLNAQTDIIIGKPKNTLPAPKK